MISLARTYKFQSEVSLEMNREIAREKKFYGMKGKNIGQDILKQN